MLDKAPAVPLGGWTGPITPAFGPNEVAALTHRIRDTAFVVVNPATGAHGVVTQGAADRKSVV